MSLPRRGRPIGGAPRAMAALLLVVVVAGCLGTFGGVEYESHAFDHAPPAGPAIEGGISISDDDGGQQHHVALVASDEETERFDRDLLEAEGAWDFVEGTDFERSYLVVFQAFPASSQPDYRVEEIERTGGRLELHVDRSSSGGTDDVTVETLLVRVDRGEQGVPDEVTVTADEGVEVSTAPNGGG